MAVSMWITRNLDNTPFDKDQRNASFPGANA